MLFLVLLISTIAVAFIDLSGIDLTGKQLYINVEAVPETSLKSSKQILISYQSGKPTYLFEDGGKL